MRAVLFDMDGTLVESDAAVARAWSAWAAEAEYGVAPEALSAAALGVSAAECLVVEDAEAGLDAGRAAGARTAALRGLDGDLRLTSLHDLIPELGLSPAR